MQSLVVGRSKMCKSCSASNGRPNRAHKLIGGRFGRLVAISRVPGTVPGKNAKWNFQCDCGNRCVYDSRIVGSRGCLAHVACPECENRYGPEWKRGHLSLEMAFYAAGSSGNRKKREFLITIDEYDLITTGKGCFYCGANEGRCGLDRKDSRLGYVFDNCVPCCLRCNRMKTNLSVCDFLEHVKKICLFNAEGRKQ